MTIIGLWAAHTQLYLLVVTISTFVAFSLMILFKPLLWARLVGWNIPADTDLTIYFARCLGSFAVVVNLLMLRAALTGVGVETILQLFALFSLLMVLVHILGALEHSQPKLETYEIGFWAMLVLLSLMFYPSTSLFA